MHLLNKTVSVMTLSRFALVFFIMSTVPELTCLVAALTMVPSVGRLLKVFV